jgi:NAD(P)-dependent dehydrogenase (short-subunit alcohol dehydrogenase family)
MKVWVIGGTSGIGAAVADHFAIDGKGTDVFITGKNIDVRSLDELEGYHHCHGPFDTVVYSAGINWLNWIVDQPAMMPIYDVNVAGFVRVLGILSGSGCQSVVAISSDAASRPMRTSIAYCASKAALDMAVRCAAREMAPMRINAVSPGMTANTEMTAYIDEMVPFIRGWTEEHAADYEKSQSPIGRRGTPQEIARVVYDVATGPDFLTGSIVTVNGGR